MNSKTLILQLLLLNATLFPVLAQESSSVTDMERLTESEWFHLELATRDAEYEHQLHFKNQSDEIDFWTDQRRFEQALSQRDLRDYKAYRKGKKLSYLKHTEVCKITCGHGDFYLRQASMYLQFDDGSAHSYMTFSELKRGRGWEVSYVLEEPNPQ
ncbi:MAG: hypothetical protein WBN56_04770 [Robiginitalea sp.]|uniref:hypothetical protein n=1 Tax=Robiginitalea sp. TaxID=1902411 RepID=UPI003C77DF47